MKRLLNYIRSTVQREKGACRLSNTCAHHRGATSGAEGAQASSSELRNNSVHAADGAGNAAAADDSTARPRDAPQGAVTLSEAVRRRAVSDGGGVPGTSSRGTASEAILLQVTEHLQRSPQPPPSRVTTLLPLAYGYRKQQQPVNEAP